jgi:hypothetical protein
LIAIERLSAAAVQQVRAADRFAHKIAGFLKSFYAARSRRLMRKPLYAM